MRIMTPSLLLLFTSSLFAGEPKDAAAKKELATFQGTWVLQSSDRDGKKVPQEGSKIKLIITGNNFRLSQESSAVIGHKGTFALDPSKKPKTTEVTVAEGPDKGKTFRGIYELSDDDYKVCFAPPGKERPKEFVSKPESGHILQVWKREKK
jgi:uncharacterized protein (TIGR03067 family)